MYAGTEGLSCDDCGKEIVEGYTWTCPACDKPYYGDEAADAENDYDSETGCGDEDCHGEDEE